MASEQTVRAVGAIGGGRVGARGTAAIDLVHLARQTFGSEELEREILRLFVTQSRLLVEAIAAAEPVERAPLAHRLEGSARGVGAGRIAAICAALQTEPTPDEVRRLLGELAEADEAARAFVAAIL